MGAALGAAENLGIKDDFKQRVQHMLEPRTSAILVILRKATYDKFVEALRPYGGAILRTSLSHEAEQPLMKILHGGIPRYRPGSSQRPQLRGRPRRPDAALTPRAAALPGRVMWLRTASSSLVTKRTSEQERWTDEDRQ
jgi:hypothetical protein